jgi:hypothetical protein
MPTRVPSRNMPAGIKAFGDRLLSNIALLILFVFVDQKNADHHCPYEQ